MDKSQIQVGVKVNFTSGNFYGLTGIITEVDWNSDNQNAIYGYYHKVQLSNGKIGFIEKSEHFEISSSIK